MLVPDEPVDLPQGQPLLVHVERINPAAPAEPLTGEELLNSGLVGLWRDRADLPDSPAYARQLREAAQHARGR